MSATASAASTPTVIGVPAPQEDVDAIVAFVAGVQHAQQNTLTDAFLSVFREDAIWTTAHGKRLTGLPEISAFTRKVLPPQADSPVTATYTVDLILFIRPDVAAVKIRQRPVSRAEGAYLDEIFHGQRTSPSSWPPTPRRSRARRPTCSPRTTGSGASRPLRTPRSSTWKR
ncbi:SgcJ/EcaC family oxidoreductase [Streptomyces parvus]|uniref:SgcJ/EcaC family oxidoreductase n=1 Tax=Streptomyces parvus TaxID=66428 RepID=UPI003F4BE2BC